MYNQVSLSMGLVLFVLFTLLVPSAQPQCIVVTPPQKEPQPPKQERIVVGSAVQAPPVAPLGARWVGMRPVVTHEQIEGFDRTVMHDPSNLCSRGWLIASIPYPSDRELQDLRLTRVDSPHCD